MGVELFTDLYELTMVRAYWEAEMREEATFSLFVRRLPERRNLLLACGIDQALQDLETLRFSRDSLDYLASLDGRFPDPFLKWLEGYRFSGDVWAVAEGTPVFGHEPILEIAAPIAEAQLLETLLLNRIGLQTMLASKALRVVRAAQGRPVLDFGGRRAHGLDSAIDGARAFAIAGVAATANVLGAQRHGLNVAGTVAHAYIEASETEAEAFEAFARIFPGTTLLLDTYDPLEATDRVVALKMRLGAAFQIGGVRIDSGDLSSLSKQIRGRLDAGGLEGVKIFVSGGLNEDKIAQLLADGAPIDGFGVGTDMSVSADAPSLDIVYKLTEYAGEGRLKLAAGKRTLPGRKQVFRRFEDGIAAGDVIARAEERLPGEPLLRPVLRAGQRLEESRAPLSDVAAHATREMARLPAPLTALAPAAPYPVDVSPALTAYEAQTRSRIADRAAARA